MNDLTPPPLSSAMDELLIYRKTRLGATELAAATHGALSPAARRVLILLDGRRSIGELSDLFGAPEVERVIFDLVAQGFAREVDPQADPHTTQIVSVTVPGTVSGSAEFALPQAAAQPRGALAWVVALVGVAAIGAGVWYGVRSHSDNTALAAAQPDAAGQTATAAAGETLPTDQPGTRELPLSGLPPVTVTLASTSEGRRARALAASAIEASEAAAQETPEKPAPRARAAPPAAPSEPPAFPPRTLPAASEPEPPAEPARADVVPVASSGAEATKLAAVASGESRSDAIGSPVATASAAAVASAATPPLATLPTAPLQSPASVAPVTATGFTDTPASTPAQRAAAGGADGAAAGQQLASVAPPPRPQNAPIQLRPRRHDPPEFPARALRAHVFDGHVIAHISITAEGKVDQVEIVKATPPRVFDDEVKRTLTKWTFEPPGRATDTTVEFDFKP